MAIGFRGSVVNSVTNGGTVSLNLTGITGLAQNDIVIAFGAATGGTPADPSGYTPVDNAAPAASMLARLSYKIQTASVDTSISFWDTGGTGDSGTAIAMAFSGVDTASPLDTTTIEVAGTGLTSSDPGAIVPTVDNCCIVILSCGNVIDTNIGTVTDYTQPTSHTTTSDDNNDTTIAGAYRILVGGGSVSQNPAAWSTWASSADRATYTMALRPSVPGQPYDLHEGGVKSLNPTHGGQNFQVWRKALSGLFLPKPRFA